MKKHRGGRFKRGALAAQIFDEERINGINADRTYPAPGANGPAPLPAQGALAQAGRIRVVASPGDPNFSNELAAKQHPKGEQVKTHPAHCDRADRGSRSNGQIVLEAGAANAAMIDSAS